MSHVNVEIKARCRDPGHVRNVLVERGAEFRGTDRQIDTYFRCRRGRLKLREGNIEHSLIHYRRRNVPGPAEAKVTLCHPLGDPALKAALTEALGVLVIVSKTREIHFIDNVKFHIDEVDELGAFVEIEAIDDAGVIGRNRLLVQCRRYMDLLGIARQDLISGSYSDMLLAGRSGADGNT